MAKIAYVGLPAHGHTNPTIPIMKELVDRGHHVLYYNAASFREKLTVTGVDFQALPEPLPTEKEVAESMHQFINASLMFAKMSRPLARHLVAEFEEKKPDLVIYDSAAMWGYIAARTHQIPQICFITTFVLDGSQKAIGWRAMANFIWGALPHVPHLLRWRRGMAKEFGAENSGGITEYAPLNLVFTSAEFHPPNNFIDGRFRFVGPAIDPELRDGAFPFERLTAGTKVYISLGTINHLNTGFYQDAFAAFGDYPAQFILSVGKNTDMDSLGDIPENFLVRPYVPQLDVLAQADVFITHGGMNSTHEGLYYGVPEIVVPQHFEQLLNGRRVADAGAGILLTGQPLYGRVAPAELRGALDQVLQDEFYRQNAKRIGQSLNEAGGVQAAVAEIEAFIAHEYERAGTNLETAY